MLREYKPTDEGNRLINFTLTLFQVCAFASQNLTNINAASGAMTRSEAKRRDVKHRYSSLRSQFKCHFLGPCGVFEGIGPAGCSKV